MEEGADAVRRKRRKRKGKEKGREGGRQMMGRVAEGGLRQFKEDSSLFSGEMMSCCRKGRNLW